MRRTVHDRFSNEQPSLNGLVLLAHPVLKDPNFAKSVVLIANYTQAQGAFGIVLNKPLNRTLSQVYSEYMYSKLANVPVYWGGPVDAERLVITAWQRSESLGMFQLHFGITPDQAEALLSSHHDIEIRCFQGISGWEQGQLEREFVQMAWLPMGLSEYLVEHVNQGPRLWNHLLMQLLPQVFFDEISPKKPFSN